MAPGENRASRLELSNGIHTLSLDVFDTVLLRRLMPEKYRFKKIAERVSSRLREYGLFISPKEVYRSRVMAAKIEYQTAPHVRGEHEGRYENILKLQMCALGLIHEYSKLFTDEEIDYEISVLSPNPWIIKVINDARKERNMRVIAVSDMYLPSHLIHVIMRAHNVECLFDHVYVSSDIGLTKAAGGLFDYISETEKLSPDGYLHLGDNQQSDFVSPKKKDGMLSTYLEVKLGECVMPPLQGFINVWTGFNSSELAGGIVNGE